MRELIAKANQAILEAQCLRRQQQSLRVEAKALVSRLGETVVRAQRTDNEVRRTVRDLLGGNAESPAGTWFEAAAAE